MKLILLTLLLAIGITAPAAARLRVIAPPGNSGVGQYVETVPTAGGGRPTSTVHPVAGGSHGSGGGGSVGGSAGGGGTSGGGSATGGTIAPATQRALVAHGAAGAAAAAFANATAPSRARPVVSHAAGRTRSAVSTPPSANGSSPMGSLLRAVTGSTSNGGLGPLLPVILIGSLFGAAALALLRRRTS
jgi:hypothetical protein